jgi:predicted nucleic acid-binding protein
VEESTADLEARAVGEWLERFDDQDFSLADGVSFVVMADAGIRETLTLDIHFTVAGYTVVPSFS